VEDSTVQKMSLIQLDNLSLVNVQQLKSSFSQNSFITHKIYSIKACMSETALQEKLHNRLVTTNGAPLSRSTTDGQGCIYWEEKIKFEYRSKTPCQSYSKIITFPRMAQSIVVRYSVETVNDKVSDLDRSSGCQEINDTSKHDKNEINSRNLALNQLDIFFKGETSIRKGNHRDMKFDTQVKSCLHTKKIDGVLANSQIEIEIIDKEEQGNTPYTRTIPTDHDGCFSHNFESKYRQYQYSHWIEKQLKITVRSGPLDGEVIQTRFFINPWESNRSIFGKDARFERPRTNPYPNNNRLHIDGVMYVQVGNDIENFSVNNFLGLTISKSYQVVLRPRVDRGHLFSKNSSRYVPVADGKFKLKFMLLAPDKDDIEITNNNFEHFTYITGAETIVNVKDGTINSLVNLPIRLTDLPRLATRTVSVFKLEALPANINARPDLIETIVTGFFKAKITWIKTNVFQSDILQMKADVLKEKYDSQMHSKLITKIQDQINNKSFDMRVLTKIDGLNLIIGNEDKLYSEEVKNLAKNEETVDHIRNHEYKKKIEKFFSNISNITRDKVYADPILFENDSPKSIYLRHLTKDDQNIEYLDSKKSGDNAFIEMTNKEIKDLYKDAPSVGRPRFISLKEKPKEFSVGTKEILHKICRKLFPEEDYKWGAIEKFFNDQVDWDYKRCFERPHLYFETSRAMHSLNIQKATPLFSNGMKLSINSRFDVGSGYNESEYVSRRVGVDTGFKLPLGELFGIGIKLYEVSHTVSTGTSEVENRGDGVSSQKDIIVEKFNIKVEGLFEKCVYLKGKTYLSAQYYEDIYDHDYAYFTVDKKDYEIKVNKNFYICQGPELESYTEAWYYIQATVPSATLLRDSFGPTEIKFIKVVRSQSNFNQFKTLFEDKTRMYRLEKEVGQYTPDLKLYQNWGHLIDNDKAPSVDNELILTKQLTESIEGSFPGTIQQ
jgi:hypothetical protein